MLTIDNIERMEDVGRATFKITVPLNTTSEWVVLPNVKGPFTVRVIPGSGGTARVETSTSSTLDIQKGTENAEAWDVGDVTASTTDVLMGPVTAIRLVATTADAVLEVVA